MITLNKIRKNLIEAIKQSGLTQTEIARRLGVKQATIACYISDKKNAMPALDTFAKLCAVLDLDANEILCVGEFGGEL
ncbi:MAG: helix-turn-helix domain-containing protein [Roseburia sp.]|nr:helix-turn-helix domain-containing protein [Roseburia sp.]